MKKDILWFKETVAPKLQGYDIKYRFYEEGDFGSLNQVLLESKKIGGQIDFWGGDWLGIYVWDYIKSEELMNVLLEPDKTLEKEKDLERMQSLLEIHAL
jgi:hypothetical protein